MKTTTRVDVPHIFEIMGREKAEAVVPLQDCSGRDYGEDEREDIIRYVLFAAEIQRDRDEDALEEMH